MTSTVLIIENNDANMTLATFLLDSAGYTVIGAGAAEAGLKLARESQPNLILMDIQLPGIDGLEATRRLKADETTRHIPVLALTAVEFNGDESRMLDAGCDGVITKPISHRTFLASVAAHVTPVPTK